MDFVTRIEHALFKQKPMDENQEQSVAPETTTPDVESSAAETPVEPQSPPQDTALNCPDCNGSGLVNESTRCSSCQGTGKSQNNPQSFPDGTQVIRPDGTFNVVHGELVRQE